MRWWRCSWTAQATKDVNSNQSSGSISLCCRSSLAATCASCRRSGTAEGRRYRSSSSRSGGEPSVTLSEPFYLQKSSNRTALQLLLFWASSLNLWRISVVELKSSDKWEWKNVWSKYKTVFVKNKRIRWVSRCDWSIDKTPKTLENELNKPVLRHYLALFPVAFFIWSWFSMIRIKKYSKMLFWA